MKNNLLRGNSSAFGEPVRILLAAIALVMTVFTGLPTVVKLACVILAIFVLLIHNGKPKTYTQPQLFCICFAVAIGIITICSKSSFLYPLNDWDDANCFFTVGKSMMNGIVPYRDLLEQKGPFLYFLHGLAWLVSKDTFIGVYLIEILAAAFFLFYIHRCIQLFSSSPLAVYLIPVYAAIIYTARAFAQGDSVEELSLPLIAYAMWVGLDSICSKREITNREYFIVGLTAGLIFWSKFTLVGFYPGWYVIPAATYIRQKNWGHLLHSILFVLLGVAASTAPFVVYFGIHGAIGDWLTVYLYNNLFAYSRVDSGYPFVVGVVYNILKGGYATARNNLFIPVMSLLALWYLLRRHLKAGLYFGLTAAFALTFISIGGVFYPYYAFLMSLFLPFGILPVLDKIPASTKKDTHTSVRKMYLIPIVAICLLICLVATPNRYLLGTEKEELPQYKFASIIGTDGSASLLNYGFLDGGFHTVTNTFPDCKVFCLLNITKSTLLGIQDDYVAQGRFEYIVSQNMEITDSNYVCVSTCEFISDGENCTFYLYRHI